MSIEEPERRARRILLMAASVSAVGVAIAGTANRVAGGVIVVVGWLAFLYGLHAFGRGASSASSSSAPPSPTSPPAPPTEDER